MESFPRRSNPTIDRISALPDSILCHILSFLPSKHASSTSILSKRWKFVWLSVLTLHFDDKTFKDFKTFREFVYTTMFKLRDKRTSIHSFTFKLGDSSRFNQKELNRIFKFVNKRGVQYLDFHMLDKKHRIKLPQCVINFKTLQVLKLTHLTMRDFDHMELSMLKTLHLSAVYFKSPQDFAKFLFGCPVLLELHTDIIIFTDSMQSPLPLENFNALPNLVKATIIHDFYYYTPMAMNLVCKTKILHVEKMWMSLTELPMFHNLTHMELSVHDRERDYCYGNCTQLLEILSHFPKLQHFIIQNCGTEKNTCYDCWKHPVTTPECISSQLKTCCIRGYNGTVYELKFAKYIMEHSKVLETMIVKSTTGLLKGQNLLEFFFSYTRVSKRCKLLYD